MKKKYFITIIIFCLVMLVNIPIAKAAVIDRDMAIASSMVYGSLKANKTIKENFANSSGEINDYSNKHEMDDWMVIDYTKDSIKNIGLSALTLERNNEIIIAFKGTDTEYLTDFICGIANFHAQEPFANNYVNKIMDKYSKKSGNYTIYVTGHSLGGYLAQTSGVKIYQTIDKYSNLKLGRIVTFDAMGLNFIQLEAILRLRTISTLKKMSNAGKLIQYATYGDMVSAGGVYYGEFRTVLPSIDGIAYHRENYQTLDSVEKISKLSAVLTTIIQGDILNVFKTDVNTARNLYKVDSIVAYLNLVHKLDSLTSINCNRTIEPISVKITDASDKEITESLTINKSIKLRAKTKYASCKTYKWYVSNDGKNWGNPICVSSLYEKSTTSMPTNCLEIDINSFKSGETKYYKVESYYDDKYTASKYQLNKYVPLENQNENYNSGKVEKVIKITREGKSTEGGGNTGTNTSSINSVINNNKLMNILKNITTGSLMQKLFNILKGLKK